MLHITHNFFEDFNSAVKANDKILLLDLINDKVAQIIVFDKGKLNQALGRNSKTIFNEKTPNYTYISELIKRVRTDAQLRKDLALIIIWNNSDRPISDKNFIANGRGKNLDLPKEKELISEANKIKAVDKVLGFSIGKENEELLKKKVKGHSLVKKTNFGAEARKELNVAGNNMSPKSKMRYTLKVATWTAVLLAATFFGLKWYLNKRDGGSEKSEPSKSESTEAATE